MKTWTCTKCEKKIITEGKTPQYWRYEFFSQNYDVTPVLICFECFKKPKI